MQTYSTRLLSSYVILVLLVASGVMLFLLLGNVLFPHHSHRLVAQTPSSSAATLVVRSLADAFPLPGDPTCGETCTLRDAIRTADALAGTHTIVFANGLSGEITLVSTITINGDITIDGPGDDLLTISLPGNDFSNRRALQIANTANVTLTGMTIQRTGDGSGGGIQNDGNLTIEEVVITNSDYNGVGGGLFNSGTLTIVDSILSDNRGLQGGGIYNTGNLTIIDSKINGSNATSISGEGTAIRNEGGVVTITGTAIDDNLRSVAVANFDGGSITVEGSTLKGNLQGGMSNEGITSTLEISGSNFADNVGFAITNGGYIGGPEGGVITVTASIFEGPAIDNTNGGTVTLLDSLLKGDASGDGGTAISNTAATFNMHRTTVTEHFLTGFASQGAGIVNERGGNFLIEQSTISNNRADEDSEEVANDSDRCAGILVHGINTSADAPTTMTIRNSTISGNRALRSGGGLCAISGSPDTIKVIITHSTIVGNRAIEPRREDEGGGGIYLFNSDLTLVNSIVANNYRDEGTALDNILQDSDNPGILTTQGVNLSDTQPQGFGANDLVNTAPLLAPLAENGGPTATHALLNGSSALDAAHADLCLAIDQRGEPRPIDGDDDEIAACDIGAYEAQSVPPVIKSDDIYMPFVQSGS